MKRFLKHNWLTIALLAWFLVGFSWFLAERTWAGIYLSYASGSEFFLVDGTNCAGGVTAALQSYPDRRIVFHSPGGTAESTIKAWSAGSVGLGSNLITNPGFESCTADWTATSSVLTCPADPVSGVSALRVTGTLAGSAIAKSTAFSVTSGELVRSYMTAKHGDSEYGFVGQVYLNVDWVYSLHAGYKTDAAYTAYTKFYTLGTTSASYRVWLIAGGSIAGRYDQFDDAGVEKITSPGGNGCLLGPVTVGAGFNPNAITHFQIMGGPDPRSRDRTKTRILYDSRYQ